MSEMKENQDVECATSSCEDGANADQSNALTVPSPLFSNAYAVDSVMDVDKKEEETAVDVVVEDVEAGELPKQWGTPFLRKLRCKWLLLLSQNMVSDKS